MKVRDDIYPWAKGVEMEKIFQGLAGFAFETFSGLFSSEDDVIKYINNFEDPNIAKQFIEIAEYYHFAKFYYCPKCFAPKRIENCPECKNPIELPAHIVLIMMISIMERLSGKFLPFRTWVKTNEVIEKYQELLGTGKIKDYRSLVETLEDDYNQEYGSLTQVTCFFKDFMSKAEKVQFVKSIKYVKEVPELPPRGTKESEEKNLEESFEVWEKAFEKRQQIRFKNNEDIKAYVEKNHNKTTFEPLPQCFNNEKYWECYAICNEQGLVIVV